MRKTLLIAAAAALLLPCAAQAADCKLQIVDLIKLEPIHGGLRELMPVRINGVQKKFVFDTGGSLSQMSRATAEELKLPVHQGRTTMTDAEGRVSNDEATIHELIIGHARGTDVVLPVVPGDPGADGIVALDYLHTTDADLDFSTDTLKLFSEDHCPGQVVYWTSPTNVGVVPITVRGLNIIVPVMLDGHEERAVIDTGAPDSYLMINEAKRVFDLTMGGDDAPEIGKWNNDDRLKVYSHQFKTLSFGDVTVNNPKLNLMPNAFGRDMSKAQLVGDRTKSEKDLLDVKDMLIGMDVLRKLHVYIALGEQKLYVSPAAATSPPAAPAQ